MEVVSGDNWTTGAISRAKLQLNHHHQHSLYSLGCTNSYDLRRRPWIGFTCYGAIEIIVVLSLLLLTNQHPVFLQAGCPSCRPTNSVKALKGKISHPMDLLTPNSPRGLPTLSLTTNSSGYLGGGLPCLSSALWCQYPCHWALNLVLY